MHRAESFNFWITKCDAPNGEIRRCQLKFLARGDISEPTTNNRSVPEIITREVWLHASYNHILKSQMLYIQDAVRNIAMTDEIKRLSPNIIAHCKPGNHLLKVGSPLALVAGAR